MFYQKKFESELPGRGYRRTLPGHTYSSYEGNAVRIRTEGSLNSLNGVGTRETG